jgi:hypothetical protein
VGCSGLSEPGIDGSHRPWIVAVEREQIVARRVGEAAGTLAVTVGRGEGAREHQAVQGAERQVAT